MEATSATLLDQLKQPQAEVAWERFCRVYGPLIIRYGRKLGLGDADARDVMQESLLVLMRLLPQFDYDPGRGRFRNYLLTIVHRQVAAHWRRGARMTPTAPDEMDALRDADAVDAEVADERWQEALLDEAWVGLQRSGRLKSDTVAVFEAYVIRGDSCEEVAKKHGLAANTVYQMKNRVIAMLRTDVRRMLAELDPAERP